MAVTTVGEASPVTTTTVKASGIQATLVSGDERPAFLPRVFGRRFMQGEAGVFNWMRRLCRLYNGGYWDFVDLSNGGFYLRLVSDKPMALYVDGNGFNGELSADAASIVACLFAINELLFDGADELTDAYYALRDYAGQHPESKRILNAID
ncbi:MAG: antirestriction protein [Burkholderiales bacterium PBB5]|nr:MAG: antirestriction protein [Burkholderiales bacterium PBB5]